MKLLLLGGTGWIGSHLIPYLKSMQIDAVGASRGNRPAPADGIPQTVLDKNDPAALGALLDREQFDVIIDTVPAVDSINAIAAHAKGLRHYLHCSSTGGYAPLPFIPCNETAPYGGFEGGTGWSAKAAVDKLAMNLFLERGFPATVLRPCYITGPGLLPLDNFGGRRKDFIPDLLAEKEVVLPNDGQALLQPVHVDDLARAFACAIDRRSAIGQIYNITGNYALTITDYVKRNAAALGKTAHIRLMPLEEMLARYGNQCDNTWLRFFATHMCFDNTKAKTQLDWYPRFSPEEAIASTAIWASRQV